MCPILPWLGADAFTHCEGSRPTPQTMYAWVSVFGARCPAGFGWFMLELTGCAIRECSDDVRFGMTRLSSCWLGGRDPPERGREVIEGAIAVILCWRRLS